MAKFIAIDPGDVPQFRETHRGRVSYPLLKEFLETGIVLARLDRKGMQQSYQALYSSLRAYIEAHALPIKLVSRAGDIYLLRLDLNADGTPNPNYEPADSMRRASPFASLKLKGDGNVPEVSSEVVLKQLQKK